jgi:hypothetical protein
MNADKNKQDGSFPEADEVCKAARRLRILRLSLSFSRLSTFVSHTPFETERTIAGVQRPEGASEQTFA